MFTFGKKNAARPMTLSVVSFPSDKLPFAVVAYTPDRRAQFKDVMTSLTAPAMDAFVRTEARYAMRMAAEPYATYPDALPADPVAQLWQPVNCKDAAESIAVRRVGPGRFRIQAAEGANALVLYKGDEQLGRRAAALLCVTNPDDVSKFVPAGDPSVFDGAIFLPERTAREEFTSHVYGRCSCD